MPLILTDLNRRRKQKKQRFHLQRRQYSVIPPEDRENHSSQDATPGSFLRLSHDKRDLVQWLMAVVDSSNENNLEVMRLTSSGSEENVIKDSIASLVDDPTKRDQLSESGEVLEAIRDCLLARSRQQASSPTLDTNSEYPLLAYIASVYTDSVRDDWEINPSNIATRDFILTARTLSKTIGLEGFERSLVENLYESRHGRPNLGFLNAPSGAGKSLTLQHCAEQLDDKPCFDYFMMLGMN